MPRSPVFALCAGFVIALAPAAGAAQDLRTAFLLVDRFQPSLPGEVFSQVASPRYLGGWPLVVRSGLSVRFWGRMPGADRLELDALWSMHPTFSIAPHESFLLFIGLPVALQQYGLASAAELPAAQQPNAAFFRREGARLLDPRIGARARIFGHGHDPFSLHLTGQLHLDSQWFDPVANNGSDHSVRAQLQLTAAGCAGSCMPHRIFGAALRYAIELGPHLRKPLAVNGQSVGHEVQIAGAIGVQWRAPSRLFDSFELRGALELMSWHPIDSPRAPVVSIALPLGVVLSQDVDVSVAPSLESPTLGRLSLDPQSPSQWTPGLHLRVAYALHDRALDRYVERAAPGQRSAARSDQQDTDRDGRADAIDDPCPNDPSRDCSLSSGAHPTHNNTEQRATADDALVWPSSDIIVTRGVTTLVRPLVASQRVDDARASGAGDPGYVFDDPVLARRIAAELSRLRSQSRVFVAFAVRFEHDGATGIASSERRAYAFAAIARAIVSAGLLNDQIELTHWLPDNDASRAPPGADRVGVVLLAKRRSSRLGVVRASSWMPRVMWGQTARPPAPEIEPEALRSATPDRPSDSAPLAPFLAN